MTLDDESIETLLARSLDDDQESRRYLLELAEKSEALRVWEATSESSDSTEADVRMLAKEFLRIFGTVQRAAELEFQGTMQQPLELAFSGTSHDSSEQAKLTQLVSAVLRLLQKSSVGAPTMRLRLAAMSAQERDNVLDSFVAEARVSSAYEGVDMRADGMKERLRASLERGTNGPTPTCSEP